MLTSKQISTYRQQLRNLIEQVNRISSRCLFVDPLVRGTPAQVFRKCGRKTCKCAVSDDARHGPYKVIQVIRDGKSRQVCLRRQDEQKWDLAKRYQFQIAKLSELEEICQRIQGIVSKAIEQRLVELE